MKNTEKAILALVLNDDNLTPLLLENCDESFFEDGEHKTIFREIKKLWDGKCGFNYVTFWDHVRDRVSEFYYETFCDAVKGVDDPRAFLLQNVLRAKQEKAKRRLLGCIDQYLKEPVIDWEEIKGIVNDASVRGLEIENPDIQSAYDRYVEWVNRQQTGITLGFPSLDKLTDTFCYGELLSFIGRTTTGKTWLALNVICHILETTTETVGLFSMEMPKQAIFERLFQLHHNMSRWDVKLNICEKERVDPFMEKFKQLKIYEKIYSVSDIARIVEEQKIKIAFIDFLSLMRSETEGNLYAQTTQKITDLAQMAKEKEVLVIVMVQLSRAAGDGSIPVTIDMCRESGAIEEISHFIYGIYQPAINPDLREKWDRKLCVQLLKNKRGPTSSIPCSFDYAFGGIREIPKDGS